MSANHNLPAVHGRAGMETAVSYILIGGVILSLALLAAGTAIYAIQRHSLVLAYSLPHANLFQFAWLTFARLAHGKAATKDVINLGIIVLMLTPYVRVAFSVIAFAFLERDIKYTIFTLFVLGVLTYSLFLRF